VRERRVCLQRTFAAGGRPEISTVVSVRS
jgi:hypothetical protein